MIVSVGSIRGAPGATSWALLLGAAWPRELSARRVVLEADPAGGVIGARYGLGVEPGAVRMVTGMRRNGDSSIQLEEVAREIEPDLFVVPGPESGEQARPVWREGARSVAGRLAMDESVWLVDIGRTDETNPSLAFVDDAALTVVVIGSRQEDLVQLPTRVAALRERCERVAVIVSGSCAFGSEDVRQFCGADATWSVDTRDNLIDEVGRLLSGTRARRSWLWRRALDVAAGVFQLALTDADSVGSEAAG